MYTNSKFGIALRSLIEDGLISDHGEYKQTMMPHILDVRRPGVARETIRTDIVKPDILRARTQETFVEATVQVHPTARLLPGTKLTGKTVIGPNVVVWGSHLHNVEVGENSEVENCLAENTKMGRDNKHSNSRITNSKFGDNVKSSHNLVERNIAADGTKFEPRAVIIGGKSAGIIGSPFIDSNVKTHLTGGATGLETHHMPTAVRATDFPEVKAEIGGETKYFANVTEIGGSSTISRTGSKQRVVIESAFVAADTDIDPGAKIGFGAYVKNQVGEEDVLPFTFKAGAGLVHDVIGGVLDMPGVVFMHLISRTKAAMPQDQRHLVDKLIVAKIKETLAACQEMLADDDKNPGYTEQQLTEGIERFETHLREGRWEMANHEFTRGRWLRLSPEGVGRVEYEWVSKEDVHGALAAAEVELDDLGKGAKQAAGKI